MYILYTILSYTILHYLSLSLSLSLLSCTYYDGPRRRQGVPIPVADTRALSLDVEVFAVQALGAGLGLRV